MKPNADLLLHIAHRVYEKADRDAMEALKRALPPGRVVKWRHGDRWRMGEVIEILGFSYHAAGVRVVSATTGKKYDVSAYAIRTAIHEEGP